MDAEDARKRELEDNAEREEEDQDPDEDVPAPNPKKKLRKNRRPESGRKIRKTKIQTVIVSRAIVISKNSISKN